MCLCCTSSSRLHPSIEGIYGSVGAGVSAYKMFQSSASKQLAKGMTKLAKSGLEPPPTVTPDYVGKPPAGLLPGPGQTYTDLGKQAPGGPRTKTPPIEARGHVPPDKALAKIPGNVPRTTLPSSGERLETPQNVRGVSMEPERPMLPPGPPQASPASQAGRYRAVGPLKIPPETESAPIEEASSFRNNSRGDVEMWNEKAQRWEPVAPDVRAKARMPEVEEHITHLVRTGKISRGEVMRMVRIGILDSGSAKRIFAAAK